jgi:hypothetical protein
MTATEQALQATDTVVSTDMLQDKDLLLEQTAALRLLNTSSIALLKVPVKFPLLPCIG